MRFISKANATAKSTIAGPGSAIPKITPIPTPVRAECPRASEKKAMPLFTTRVPSKENSGMTSRTASRARRMKS